MENNTGTESRKLGPNEIEINIKEVLLVCIKNIKWIVICAILGAILVTGLKYYKDIQNYQNSNNKVEEEIELTEADQIAIDKYILLKTKMEQLKEYRETAILMDIDFNQAYQMKMQFSVNADEERIDDVVFAIMSYIDSGFLGADLQQESVFEGKTYIYELFNVALPVNDDATIVETPNVFTLKVYAENLSKCEQYADLAVEKIKEYVAQLNEVIGSNTCDLLQSTYSKGYIPGVYIAQKNYLTEVETISNEYKAHKNSMTEFQLKYAEGKDEEIEEVTVLEKPKLSKKMMVLGLIIGTVFSSGIVCILYIWNGKLKSQKEIQKRLGLQNLGTMVTGQDEQIEYLVAKIKVRMEHSGTNKVVLVGTSKFVDNEDFSKLVELFKSQNIEYEIIGDVLKEKTALEKLSIETKVILVEAIGLSKVKDLYEENEVCADCNAEIIGYISIL